MVSSDKGVLWEPTNSCQMQTSRIKNDIIPREKTYSSIVQRNKTQNEKWSTPPKTEKHDTIVRLRDESDPKKVLKEIKQCLNNNRENPQTFKSVKKLQGGGILVECQNTEQQAKLTEALKSKNSFEIRELKNTDPMIMFTGIEKGYKPEEFIATLIEENPEIQNKFGKDIDTKIKFITKKDCRNIRKENWILQMDPMVFKWLIKTGTVNLDLTKAYVQEYYNIAMCYKCGLFGHVSKYCKGEVCCLKCGGKHESNQCPINTQLNCPNCKRWNLKDRAHTARDLKCPAYLEKIEKYIKTTNYGNHEETDNPFLG